MHDKNVEDLDSNEEEHKLAELLMKKKLQKAKEKYDEDKSAVDKFLQQLDEQG